MNGRTNLPSALTSFIGRTTDRRIVRTALGAARLVTLTGIGGVGKTRLALRVAEQARRAFPDGVWHVDLSALPATDDDVVVYRAVAAALDLGLDATSTPREALLHHLDDASALLVLDGCEHLVHPCAQLITALLAASPGLRVLATSQRCLGVDGERRVPVAPLALPDDTEAPADARMIDAVALFYDRAATAGNALPEDDATIHAVAAICRHFDGLPLPIELATETLRALSPTELLHHVRRDRFGPLAGGKRGGPQRQRSLLSEMDWSHSLCTSAEQALWTRLSVFAGGFDLPTACTVTSDDTPRDDTTPRDDDTVPDHVLALIASLVDRSILQRDDTNGAHRTRYHFLDTVRHYGLRHLDASGEQEALHRRHTNHFLAQADKATHRWNADLPDDARNLRDALTTLIPHRPDDAVAMLVALTRTQLTHDQRFTDHLADTIPEVLKLASAVPATTRIRAYAQASWLALWHGDTSTSRPLLAQASATARNTDTSHDPTLATLLTFVQAAHTGLADADPSAIPTLARAHHEFSTTPGGTDPHFAVVAAVITALTAATVGSKDDAVATGAACAPPPGSEPSPWALSWCLLPTGFIETRYGSQRQASTALRRVLQDMWQLRDRGTVAWALLAMASIAAHSERAEAAARLLGVTQAVQSAQGDDLTQLGLFARIRDDMRQTALQAIGAERYENAYALGLTSRLADGIDFALDKRKRADQSIRSTRRLSPREYQVAELVAAGHGPKSIASILVIGVRTVDTHIAFIKQKLDLSSREDIAAWWAAQQPTRENNSGTVQDRPAPRPIARPH